MEASLAAAYAATAQATVEASVAASREGFDLTKQVVGDDKAEMVFPLMAISSAQITAGLVTYTEVLTTSTALGLNPLAVGMTGDLA